MKNNLEIINGFLKTKFIESDLSDWSKLFDIVKKISEKTKTKSVGKKYLLDNDYSGFIKKCIIKEIFKYSKQLSCRKSSKIRYKKEREVIAYYRILRERERRIFKYEEKEKQKIETWIKDNFKYFDNNDFEINDDLTIDIYCSRVCISFDLKYPINTVIGDVDYDFNQSDYVLKNLKNFPINIDGSLFLRNHNKLKFSDKYTKKDNYGWRKCDGRHDDYQDFLENVNCKYGKEIIEKRKLVKKYRMITKNSSSNTYTIYRSNQLYQVLKQQMNDGWSFVNKDLSKHSIEEDDNLYDYDVVWTEEEFLNRKSKEYIEKKKADDLKKQALSKLSKEEMEILGL